jgi:tRNA(Ile)-lysidine synthase
VVREFSKEDNIQYVDMDSFTFPLLLRPPYPGERFRPYNSPGRKKVSRILSDKKIDKRRRAGFPVLVSAETDRIIVLPGLTIAHEVRITKSTERILCIRMFPT